VKFTSQTQISQADTVGGMIGDILQRARRKQQLTQEKVALRAHLSREYVSMVERGRHSPTVDALLRICRAMGIQASEVIRELERPARSRR